jgi:hypothetical protein
MRRCSVTKAVTQAGTIANIEFMVITFEDSTSVTWKVPGSMDDLVYDRKKAGKNEKPLSLTNRRTRPTWTVGRTTVGCGA